MDLYSFFIGQWSFTRSICTGEPKQPYAQAQGQACFVADGSHQLIFEERGSILMATGTKLQFSRAYRYVFADDGLTVYFHDGPDKGAVYQAYYYLPDARMLKARALHYCGPDVYAGHYQLIHDDSFLLLTRVQGAAKDMEIETCFNRLPAAQ